MSEQRLEVVTGSDGRRSVRYRALGSAVVHEIRVGDTVRTAGRTVQGPDETVERITDDGKLVLAGDTETQWHPGIFKVVTGEAAKQEKPMQHVRQVHVVVGVKVRSNTTTDENTLVKIVDGSKGILLSCGDFDTARLTASDARHLADELRAAADRLEARVTGEREAHRAVPLMPTTAS